MFFGGGMEAHSLTDFSGGVKKIKHSKSLDEWVDVNIFEGVGVINVEGEEGRSRHEQFFKENSQRRRGMHDTSPPPPKKLSHQPH